MLLDGGDGDVEIIGRDSNQYYGDDIHLLKEKYVSNKSTNQKDEVLPVATVDDYYLTNDESIDFMVNSKTGKKKAHHNENNAAQTGSNNAAKAQ